MQTAKTEAECLLEIGVKYRRRIGFELDKGRIDFAGVKQGVFSLYRGDDPIYHFDFEGRWQRAFISGSHYLKSLDASAARLDRVREGESLVLDRRKLSYSEAGELDDSIRSVAIELSARLAGEDPRLLEPPAGVDRLSRDELLEILDAIALWDASRWFAQSELFRKAYPQGLPLLPPGRENAIVFEGNPSGRDNAELDFLAHVQTVARLWGKRILEVPPILLALSVSDGPISLDLPRAIQAIDDALRKYAGSASLGAKHVWLSEIPNPAPSAEQLAAIKSLGVARVETALSAQAGCESTDRDQSPAAWVGLLRESGLACGLIVHAEPGDDATTSSRRASTVERLSTLELGPRDFITVHGEGEPAERLHAALESDRKARGGRAILYRKEKQWARA